MQFSLEKGMVNISMNGYNKAKPKLLIKIVVIRVDI